jgi:hypothetical protein
MHLCHFVSFVPPRWVNGRHLLMEIPQEADGPGRILDLVEEQERPPLDARQAFLEQDRLHQAPDGKPPGKELGLLGLLQAEGDEPVIGRRANLHGRGLPDLAGAPQEKGLAGRSGLPV